MNETQKIKTAQVKKLGFYAIDNNNGGKEWFVYRSNGNLVSRGFKTRQEAYRYIIDGFKAPDCDDKYCEVHNPNYQNEVNQ